MLRRRLAAYAVVCVPILWACGSDSSGPDDAGFIVQVTSPLGGTLGTTQSLDVDIASSGYSGSVTVEVTGAPSDRGITDDVDFVVTS